MADQLFFERFLWFDALVRKGRYPNASSLAEHFELSVKTAQRSIEWFRDRMRAPLEYDQTRKGYYYTKEFSLPVVRLSESELLALLVSRKLLSDASAGPLGEELAHVTAKLGTLIAAGMPGSIDPEHAFSFRWHGFWPAESIHFSLVSSALLASRLLTFCYYSPKSSECTIRTVEPHHLLNYMGTWHLIAWCRERQGWRDFLLSRMSLCKIEDEHFAARPEEEWRANLEDTFGIFNNADRFEVVLRFTPERSRWVREQVWHPEQTAEELEDGGYQLIVPVSHHAEIMLEILKHGADVEVLAPEWLRERVAEEARKLAAVYVD